MKVNVNRDLISNTEAIYFVVIDYDIYLQRSSENIFFKSISLKNNSDNLFSLIMFRQKHSQNMTKMDAH